MMLSIISMLWTVGLSCTQQPAPYKSLSLQTRNLVSDVWEGMSQAEEDEAEGYARMRVKKLQASAELIVSAFKNDLAGIKKALEAGADINARAEKDGMTPLMILAAQPDSLQIVQYLLEQPEIDVNALDNRGRAAIHYAAEHHNKQAISLLLDHGAQILGRNHEMITAIKRQKEIAMKKQKNDSDNLPEASQQKQSWSSYLGSYLSWLLPSSESKHE